VQEQYQKKSAREFKKNIQFNCRNINNLDGYEVTGQNLE